MEGDDMNLLGQSKRVRQTVRSLGLAAFMILTASLFISLFVLLIL